MTPSKRRRHPEGSPQTGPQRAMVRGWGEHERPRAAPVVVLTDDVRGAPSVPDPLPRDRVRGALLGGAVGDALGWPVEFLRWRQIEARYGEGGVDRFDRRAEGGRGAVTDDTQMTLFTAEGVLRAAVRGNTRGVCHPPTVLWRAYLRWLYTQGGRLPAGAERDLVLGTGGRPSRAASCWTYAPAQPARPGQHLPLGAGVRPHGHARRAAERQQGVRRRDARGAVRLCAAVPTTRCSTWPATPRRSRTGTRRGGWPRARWR
jgi:hypothetical protein